MVISNNITVYHNNYDLHVELIHKIRNWDTVFTHF